jgi:hypothetical protein
MLRLLASHSVKDSLLIYHIDYILLFILTRHIVFEKHYILLYIISIFP